MLAPLPSIPGIESPATLGKLGVVMAVSLVNANLGNESFVRDIESVLGLSRQQTDAWTDEALAAGSLNGIHGPPTAGHRDPGENFFHIVTFLIRDVVGTSFESVRESLEAAIERGDVKLGDSSLDLSWLRKLSSDDRVVGSVLASHQLFRGGRALYSEHSWFISARAITSATGKFFGFLPVASFTLVSDEDDRLSVELVAAELAELHESLGRAVNELRQVSAELGERVLVGPLDEP